MLDLAAAIKKFNRASETYDQVDVLFREIADRIGERLPFIRLQPENILECGARTGYLARKLLDYYPDTRFIAVEMVPGLLARLVHRVDGRCHPLNAYYEALPVASNSVDMVVSSMALHWTNDLPACFREFHRILKPNGLLMLTLFGIDTLRELGESFSSCHDFLHQFPEMHDLGDSLIRSGLQDPVMEREIITIEYSNLIRLFQDFKQSGMGNVHQQRLRGLFGKNRWQQAISHYNTLKKNNTYPATFEIIYGHAWKVHDADDYLKNEYYLSTDIPIMKNT